MLSNEQVYLGDEECLVCGNEAEFFVKPPSAVKAYHYCKFCRDTELIEIVIYGSADLEKIAKAIATSHRIILETIRRVRGRQIMYAGKKTCWVCDDKRSDDWHFKNGVRILLFCLTVFAIVLYRAFVK